MAHYYFTSTHDIRFLEYLNKIIAKNESDIKLITNPYIPARTVYKFDTGRDTIEKIEDIERYKF